MVLKGLAIKKSSNLFQQRAGLFRIIHAATLLLSLAAFLLPALIAQYGGNWYYVRGIDMVFGRPIAGDVFGMVPQTTLAFSVVAIALALLCNLMRNRNKGAFSTALLSLIALLLVAAPALKTNVNTASIDPIAAAFRAHGMISGYYLILLSLGLSVVTGIVHILSKPAMVADLIKLRWIYVMAVPVLAYVLIFFYYPIYGVLIAFKDFSPRLGIIGSQWVGFEHFISFFKSVYFFRIVRNTLLISGYSLLFGFTFPVAFAIFLNEIRGTLFKRTIQTITYLPYFISLVVVCVLITMFLSSEGLINQIALGLGFPAESLTNYLGNSKYFRIVYVISGICQNFGWNSIIYLAAITNINPELYEAASVDGAKRYHKMLHITLPCLAPTIIIMFILAIGGLMNVGYEKIILLYNPQTYETADVISSFVYRRGIVDANYSFATAVNLFNSIISLILIILANRLSRRVSEVSLW